MRMIKMIIMVGAIYCGGIFCLSENELKEKVLEAHKYFCELKDNNTVVENTVPCLRNEKYVGAVETIVPECIKKTTGIEGKDFFIRYYVESCKDVSIQNATLECVVETSKKNETSRDEAFAYLDALQVCVTKVTGH